MHNIGNLHRLNGQDLEESKTLSVSKGLAAIASAAFATGVATAIFSVVAIALNDPFAITLVLAGIFLIGSAIVLALYLGTREDESENGRGSYFSNEQTSRQNTDGFNHNPPAFINNSNHNSSVFTPDEIRQRDRLSEDAKEALIAKGYNNRWAIEVLEEFDHPLQKALIDRGIVDRYTLECIGRMQKSLQERVIQDRQFTIAKIKTLSLFDKSTHYAIIKSGAFKSDAFTDEKCIKFVKEFPFDLQRMIFMRGYFTKPILECFAKEFKDELQVAIVHRGKYKQCEDLIKELVHCKFDENVQRLIARESYFNIGKLMALQGFHPSVQSKIISSGQDSPAYLEMVASFPEWWVQEAIFDCNYFDLDELQQLKGFNPDVQVAIMRNGGRLDFERIELLRTLNVSDRVKIAIIEYHYFNKEKLAKLQQPGISEDRQLACIPIHCAFPEGLDLLDGLDENMKINIIRWGTDPQALLGFSPEALEFLLGTDLVFSHTDSIKWTNKQLQHFKPDDINLLLKNFGYKLFTLDFTGYPYDLKSIDFSNCSILYWLTLDSLRGLEQIIGLEKCTELHCIDLDNTKFDNPKAIEKAILLIKNNDFIINCRCSNLTIGNYEKQTGRKMIWSEPSF